MQNDETIIKLADLLNTVCVDYADHINAVETIRESLTDVLEQHRKKYVDQVFLIEEAIKSIYEIPEVIIQPKVETHSRSSDKANPAHADFFEEVQLIESDIMNGSVDILTRRIELHKAMGTYCEPKSEPEQPKEQTKEESEQPIQEQIKKEPKIPTITPLHKLNNDEQEQLFKRVFKKSMYNVENVLRIPKSDPDFKKQVSLESDRLLESWIRANKAI